MLPTLITFAYENRQFAPSFGLFELGRVVDGVREDGACNERRRLGIVLFDKQGTEKELYFKAVEIIRYFALELRHSKVDFRRVAVKHNWQHPKNTSSVSVNGVEVGTLCTLHPSTLSKIDKHASVVCIELDLDDFASAPAKELEFSEPSRFPGVDFDLSLITDGKPFALIEKAWTSENIPELTGVKLVDIYDGGDFKSITVRLSFSSEERTLSMEEIQQHIDKIVKNLSALGVNLRA